jgi:hypothetical protein
VCGFSADQYLNCVTKFNIVWRVGTFPSLPMSKCSQKTCCVTVAESLFLKNVSTANAQCSSDQRCMITEGFKPLYQVMCVSPRHLQRCQHGAKFKSSNCCFCPTLYVFDTQDVYGLRSHNIDALKRETPKCYTTCMCAVALICILKNSTAGKCEILTH